MARKLVFALCVFSLTLFAAPARQGNAFCNEYTFLGIPLNCDGGGHPVATRRGLDFLWPDVREIAADAAVSQDAHDSKEVDDRRHMDSCRFQEAGRYINGEYADIGDALAPGTLDNEAAIRAFGRVQHTVQDFYAHSNWLQLLGDAGGFDPSDLIGGGSGAFPELQPLPDGGTPPVVIMGNIVSGELPTGADGMPYLPPGYQIDEPLDSDIPMITAPDGQTYRALVTGWNVPGRYPDDSDAGDGACVDGRPDGQVCDDYGCPRTAKLVHGGDGDRVCHDDSPTFVCLNRDDSNRPGWQRAFNSAITQTQFEFCRLLNVLHSETGAYDESSIPMALWVQDDEPGDVPPSTPHVFGSDCARDYSRPVPGPIGVTTSMTSIRRRIDLGLFSSVQESFVTYTGDFRDSSRTRTHLFLDDDDPIANPASPLTMCVNASDTLVVTAQGWLDVLPSPIGSPGAWDAGLEPSLPGVTLSFAGPTFGAGTHSSSSAAISADFQIAIETTDADADGLADLCGEAYYGTVPGNPDTDADGLTDGNEVSNVGTSPTDADSDDDGVSDGTEVSGTNPTNPLDADSDDDGLSDGAEDANLSGGIDAGETNPNNPDSDADALTDGCEVTGTQTTDPLDADSDDDGLTDGAEDADHNCARNSGETDPNDADSDNDQLSDGNEVSFGTDPLNPDSDGDGIQDGDDAEWLQGAIAAVPDSAFKDGTGGLKASMLAQLDLVEGLIATGKTTKALKQLVLLRTYVDGCGTVADKTDWIVDCAAQNQTRAFIDAYIANVMT